MGDDQADPKPFDISQDPAVCYAVEMILAGCLGPSNLGVVRTFAAAITATLSMATLVGYSKAELLAAVTRTIEVSYSDELAAKSKASREADPAAYEKQVRDSMTRGMTLVEVPPDGGAVH